MKRPLIRRQGEMSQGTRRGARDASERSGRGEDKAAGGATVAQ